MTLEATASARAETEAALGGQRPTDTAGGPTVLSYADRVRGCLLGGALGDALGAGIEFHDLASIRQAHGPAGVTGLTVAYGVRAPLTDDTQMTLFTAEGLIRASVRSRSGDSLHPPFHPPTVLWNAYQRWLATQRLDGPPEPADGWLASQKVLYARRAPGNACLSGLARPRPGTLDDPANPDSKGCGTVMRSAPFGLLRRSPQSSWDLAVECAVLTHGHPSGYLAAGAFAWIIAEIVSGASVTGAAASALDRLAAQRQGGEVSAALRAALGAAEEVIAGEGTVTPERVESLGGGWVAEEALAIAVYCAAALPDDPRGALLAAVNHSGDSDSTGAVCGNLVGAALGEHALPQDWVRELEGFEIVERVADDLVREIDRTRLVSDEFGAATQGWLATYPAS
ncbi:ADP-ribosylglycohydrolase family protein [Parafrankia elaeagni]|uniref:ADP-ribosylglycohydrolase family protein n=1 Tax=Parafrankia elaeagni TaxID=222534 RepID=UPI0038994C44